MAHFIGSLQGNKGEASRLGSKRSGIRAKAQGWNIGGEVQCFIDDQGRDVVRLYVTHGSNAHNFPQLVGEFIKDENGDLRQVDGTTPGRA